MKAATVARPTIPAIRLRSIESAPSDGPTVRLDTTSSGTPSAPALSWVANCSASMAVIPSIVPLLEMAAAMLGEEITCLSTTIDMGWPMWSRVNS